jgi:AraC-like DNA-binding protein
MKQENIFIKGMVCHRCELTVEKELAAIGHTPLHVSLGEVSYIRNEAADADALEKRLSFYGFSLLENKKEKVIAKVKQLVEEVYGGDFDFPERFRFAQLVQQRLQKDYATISQAFISAENKTIEQYIIEYRINKVKEFLVYSNTRLSEIAFNLNFNSVAHLSSQFRQQTGLTTSFFREINKKKMAGSFSEIR